MECLIYRERLKTLKQITELDQRGKTIIGVLTHIDKVSPANRNEKLREARGYYGQYISKFMFSTISPKEEDRILISKTIDGIKSVIDTNVRRHRKNKEIEDVIKPRFDLLSGI